LAKFHFSISNQFRKKLILSLNSSNLCTQIWEPCWGTLYKTWQCWVYNDTGEIMLMHFSLILFESIIYVKPFNVDYVCGYYSTLWTVYYCWNHRRFPCRHSAANPWYYVRLFCFGRKFNRADSKNSVMTVTRIQKKCINIF
jgi:hypothetical protein